MRKKTLFKRQVQQRLRFCRLRRVLRIRARKKTISQRQRVGFLIQTDD